MKRLICWIFGHKWDFEVELNQRVTAKCQRCERVGFNMELR
jgi:hypothetical protein